MLEYALLLTAVGLATWMAFGKGEYKQQTKEMQEVLDAVKKTKALHRRLHIKRIRDKLRNRFR